MHESPIDEPSDARRKAHSKRWPVVAFFAGVLFTILVAFFESEIISPLILPNDLCYYHTHETPFWVEFWYMHGGSNGHPEGSPKLILLFIAIGFTLGHLVVKRVRLSRK